ncbi:protein FAM151B-like isoform X2 [Sitophilus oryzae]|uniref:Protein FAM151B-like isoform X2 n=1 Tax=Sitophilus oryzae TaxID=7048 RepID=A0A6J2YI10_SITOR|nr:protein FAM151B-like isoform X2 [Sitophilus oryzae]
MELRLEEKEMVNRIRQGSLLLSAFFAVTVMGLDTDTYFPESKGNLTKITWAHAVNNASYLNETLQNATINMIEADVVLGTVGKDKTVIPIMAHPPDITSDLSLETFLELVNTSNIVNNTKHGIKLDFKSTDAFLNSTAFIKKYENESFPIWLNADILEGPNTNATPVNDTQFFAAAKDFKTATLSVGWTTGYNETNNTGSYSDDQISNMLNSIKTNNVSDLSFTFPVRAVYAANSTANLTTLLEGVSGSTLTIWSGEDDKVNVTNLRSLLEKVKLGKTYIDVPEALLNEIHLDTISSASLSSLSWVTMGVMLLFTFIFRL